MLALTALKERVSPGPSAKIAQALATQRQEAATAANALAALRQQAVTFRQHLTAAEAERVRLRVDALLGADAAREAARVETTIHDLERRIAEAEAAAPEQAVVCAELERRLAAAELAEATSELDRTAKEAMITYRAYRAAGIALLGLRQAHVAALRADWEARCAAPLLRNGQPAPTHALAKNGGDLVEGPDLPRFDEWAEA